jgi:hypothetical protein
MCFHEYPNIDEPWQKQVIQTGWEITAPAWVGVLAADTALHVAVLVLDSQLALGQSSDWHCSWNYT